MQMLSGTNLVLWVGNLGLLGSRDQCCAGRSQGLSLLYGELGTTNLDRKLQSASLVPGWAGKLADERSRLKGGSVPVFRGWGICSGRASHHLRRLFAVVLYRQPSGWTTQRSVGGYPPGCPSSSSRGGSACSV